MAGSSLLHTSPYGACRRRWCAAWEADALRYQLIGHVAQAGEEERNQCSMQQQGEEIEAREDDEAAAEALHQRQRERGRACAIEIGTYRAVAARLQPQSKDQ